MDMFQAARYFDLQAFEVYSVLANGFIPGFNGQLKKADQFLTIYNRPTRKRMLLCEPAVSPLLNNQHIIRTLVNDSQYETYMVGAASNDAHANTPYRSVIGLHKADAATIYRKSRTIQLGFPPRPSQLEENAIAYTFGDFELRTVEENTKESFNNYGNFFMWFPKGTSLEKYDRVEINNQSLTILEIYTDAGLVAARATDRPDDRTEIKFIFKSRTAPLYDVDSGGFEPPVMLAGTDYEYSNAKWLSAGMQDEANNTIDSGHVKIVVQSVMITFPPRVGDFFERFVNPGMRFRIVKLHQDPLLNEWHIWGEA